MPQLRLKPLLILVLSQIRNFVLKRRCHSILFGLLLSIIASDVWMPVRSFAGDWPQILGPHRNGIADDELLATQWSNGGPKTVWQREVGDGVAGVAVADGRVVLFHRVGDQELVEALDAQTGKRLWKTSFPTKYQAEIGSSGDGPRCVPLIHAGSVIAFGAGGDLHCLSLDDGKERWSRAAFKELKAPEGYFGAGSTPIVEGNKLLVNIGGKGGAGLVAFDLATGKNIWKATDEQASYSAPAAATIDGVRHVIFVTRLNVVSIDPDSGAVRFRFPFGQRGATVNAATPLVIDGNVFVTASYGVGAMSAKIGENGIQPIWESNEVMSSQYPTAVFKDGFLYGIDGRQDVGAAEFRCIDPKVGKVMWSKKGFGMATCILADGKLVIVKTDGELVLAEPNSQSFRPLASANVLRSTARALPALADGLLYVRDTRTLKCLDLRKQPAGQQ